MPSSGFSRLLTGPLRLGGLLAACLGWHGAAIAATPWEKALAERKQWWSLQPVQAQSPPAVTDATWSEHPMDRFLLAGMESRKLQPAADADARTVCRRLHFILTGLPPSPEESASFEIRYQADPAQAVAERSAHLLDSPRFGERWARHWMDLMRYAETHGSEGDAVIPSAWRYRDYLIRAFNQDLPLDQLIREHLAGDLLPAPRMNAVEGINESILGTAHFRLVEHGFQPIDSLDEQVKTVDSQIDVLSKAFQGLTISCARCHDHKFDAVSQRDYTALYGILASARPGQVTIDVPGLLSANNAELAALKEEIRSTLFATWTDAAANIPGLLQSRENRIRGGAGAESELKLTDALTEAWDKALAEALTDPTSPLHPWAVTSQVNHGTESGDAGREEAEFKAAMERIALDRKNQNTAVRGEFTTRTGARWIEDKDGQKWQGYGPHVKSVPAGGFTILPEGDTVLAGLDPEGHVSSAISTRQNGVLVSPGFILGESLSVRAWGGGKARVRVIVDQYPLGNNATYPDTELKDPSPTWIRFDTDYRKGSSAYLEFVTDGDDMMMAGNTGADRSWFGVSEAVVHTGKEPPTQALVPFALDPSIQSAHALALSYQKIINQALQAWKSGNSTKEELRFLDFFIRRGLLPRQLPDMSPVQRYRELEAKIPTARRAPGLLESSGTDVPLFIRGDHHKPAAVVPRGYLEVLGNTKISSPGSGRLELAEAIAGPGNPLTARVMANRIWLQVFGHGLVATPDDFGKMGSAPTHPELLDFLAAKLVADGWSSKKMLSFLLTSRAFRLSCTPSDAAVERDAANDFLSHARVRRLDAEAIRDSLLAVSGQLDLTPAGPGDDAGAAPEKQLRRSVYLNIRRTNLPAFLGVFDMPVPFSTTGRRTVTTVPAQSLALLNDPFVIHLARRTASNELRDFPAAAPAERVQRFFLTLLGRPPHPAELEQSLDFLHSGGSHPDESAWADLVQSLFNAKEFIYLL